MAPAAIIIFGITGDLAQRHLLPALYHLIKDNLLPVGTEIIGVTRQAVTTTELLDRTELCINETDGVCDPVALKDMYARTHMFQMDLTDAADYARLRQFLDQRAAKLNRLFYLSIPPQVYGPIVELLGQAGLNQAPNSRLLIEKPFGYDLESAQQLITDTGHVFSEEQLYRIDHYLAKETVQNILTFRFDNPIFEALWSGEHIDSIEISASQQIGIEGRALFYDPLGALRDFVQNHLMQLLALTTMDQPTKLDSKHIHANKHRLLQQVRTVPADQVLELARRGQYAGYRREVGNADSTTETFAALRLSIDSPRWQNVPITLWTGKALATQATEVTVNFKANVLVFRIQPNEGIELRLQAKKPGYETETQTVPLDFSYHQQFTDHGHPNAYERVLVDAVRGDHTLFATGPEVLEAWRIVQPVLDEWAKSAADLREYQPGTDGRSLLQ